MPQAITLASTCFTCFVFKRFTEKVIGVVLAVLGQILRLPIAGQSLSDQTRKQRIIEKRFNCRADERKAVSKVQRMETAENGRRAMPRRPSVMNYRFLRTNIARKTRQ